MMADDVAIEPSQYFTPCPTPPVQWNTNSNYVITFDSFIFLTKKKPFKSLLLFKIDNLKNILLKMSRLFFSAKNWDFLVFFQLKTLESWINQTLQLYDWNKQVNKLFLKNHQLITIIKSEKTNIISTNFNCNQTIAKFPSKRNLVLVQFEYTGNLNRSKTLRLKYASKQITFKKKRAANNDNKKWKEKHDFNERKLQSNRCQVSNWTKCGLGRNETVGWKKKQKEKNPTN